MKQFIPILSFVVMMASCTNKPSTNMQTGAASQVQQTPSYNVDTIGLAQFQQWKEANELAAVTQYNAPQAQHTAVVKRPRKVYHAPVAQTTNSMSGGTSSASNPVPGSSTDEDVMSSESSNAAKAPEKKGWSKAAKGTAIGAGTGAVAGAMIGKKNRVVGGVIGGVVGGAVGYGIGRHMDKKDGRY